MIFLVKFSLFAILKALIFQTLGERKDQILKFKRIAMTFADVAHLRILMKREHPGKFLKIFLDSLALN